MNQYQYPLMQRSSSLAADRALSSVSNTTSKNNASTDTTGTCTATSTNTDADADADIATTAHPVSALSSEQPMQATLQQQCQELQMQLRMLQEQQQQELQQQQQKQQADAFSTLLSSLIGSNSTNSSTNGSTNSSNSNHGSNMTATAGFPALYEAMARRSSLQMGALSAPPAPPSNPLLALMAQASNGSSIFGGSNEALTNATSNATSSNATSLSMALAALGNAAPPSSALTQSSILELFAAQQQQVAMQNQHFDAGLFLPSNGNGNNNNNASTPPSPTQQEQHDKALVHADHMASDHNHCSEQRFGASNTQKWVGKYKELLHFVRENGHSLVPLDYKANPSLAHWVKRQRCQYKAKQSGTHSTLTPERQTLLEDLDFCWDSHRAAWEERSRQLHDFKRSYGHCNVPSKFPENQSLAIWVKCQRRQFKLHRAHKKSNLNEERIVALTNLGFVWTPREVRSSHLPIVE